MDSNKATLKAWIEAEADGETVEAVVLGETWWKHDGYDRILNYAKQPRGKVLSWEEALPWISYTFNDGFGAPDCNAITAWTKSWVISVSQYDGATCPFRIARNPVDHMPVMPGGG